MSVDVVAETVERVTGLVLVLVRDLQETAGSCGSQRERRAYVRAAVTMIEGTLAGLKQILSDALPLFVPDLTAGERALLDEKAFALTDRGTVEEKDQFLRTLSNIRFTVALGEKVFAQPIAADYGGQGWSAMRISIDLRNRLTHPRTLTDLSVSEEEMSALVRATTWFQGTSIAFMMAAKTAALEKSSNKA